MDLRLVTHGSDDYRLTVDLRRRVLRTPLGLDFSDRELEGEAKDLHLAAFSDGKLVGCLVLTPADHGVLKMRQVAVEPERQGQGIGASLVRESEQVAVRHAAHRLVLHARETVVPFYEKLGYEAEGGSFEEVSIPHRFMFKNL